MGKKDKEKTKRWRKDDVRNKEKWQKKETKK